MVNIKRDDGFLSLDDVLAILRRGRTLLIVLVLVLGTGALYTYQRFPAYKARSIIYLNNAESSQLQAVTARLGGQMPGASQTLFSKEDVFLQKVLVFIRSREFLVTIADRLMADRKYSELVRELRGRKASIPFFREGSPRKPSPDEQQDELVAKLQHVLAFNAVETSIEVSVATSITRLSRDLANLVAETVVETTVQRELKDLEEAKSYLVSTAKDVENRLTAMKTEMNELRRKNPLSAEALRRHLEARISSLETELQGLEMQAAENGRTSAIIKKHQAALAKSGDDSGSRGALLKRQIENLGLKKELLKRQGYKPDSRHLATVNEELAAAKQEFEALGGEAGLELLGGEIETSEKLDELARQSTAIKVKAGVVKQQIEELHKIQTGISLDVDQSIIDIQKRTELEYGFYANLVTQITQLGVQRISISNRISILEKSTLATVRRSRSLAVTLAMVLTAAFVIGFFVAYIQEIVNPMISRAAHFATLGIGFLGEIPVFPRPIRTRQWFKTGASPTSRTPHTISVYSPQFSSLLHIRARLVGSHSDGGCKVVAIHSSSPGEGKTFTTLGLGMALAKTRKRAILVDCDNRRRSLSQEFSLSNAPGLWDVMGGSRRLEEVIFRDPNSGLDVLPTGRLDSLGEMLTDSKDLRKVVDQLRASYEFVILDTPPVNAVAEASIIGQIADVCVLCVSALKTSFKDSARAVSHLREVAGRPIVGILNRSETRASSYSTYYNRAPSEADRVNEERLAG